MNGSLPVNPNEIIKRRLLACQTRIKTKIPKRRSGCSTLNYKFYTQFPPDLPLCLHIPNNSPVTTMKQLILLLLSAFLLASAYAVPTLTCNPYPALPSNPSAAILTFSLFFDGSTTPVTSSAVVNPDGTQVLQFNLSGLPPGNSYCIRRSY